MITNEINSSSIITKSNLPETDYVINPYVGCIHSCIYCYARFMRRFSGHAEKWGCFTDVKINAPDLIPKNTNRYRGKRILLSSVTDAYNPLERKYQLTRRILEKLKDLQPELSILTKSDLVLRDIDVFKQFKICTVGSTITSLDDGIRREIEHFTSSVNDRINAIKKLKESGIRTYVFIGPILPYITDYQSIIEKTKAFSDYYMFENLNIRGSIWHDIEEWLKKKHPEMLKCYYNIFFKKNNYWACVENEIKKFCMKERVEFGIYFHH